MDGDETPRADPTPLLKQEQRGGHFIHVVDLDNAIAPEDGAIGHVAAGHGARVGEGHRRTANGTSGLKGNDRHVPLGCGFQGAEKALRVAHRFEEKPDGANLVLPHRPRQVISRRRDHFIARGDSQSKPKARVIMGERPEHRTRLSNERHRAGQHGIEGDKAGHAQADGIVVEAHAVAAAQTHAGLPRPLAQPAPQAAAITGNRAGGKNGGRLRSVGNRCIQRCLEPLIAEADDHMIHDFGNFGEAWIARDALNLAETRVHGIYTTGIATGLAHQDHAVTDTSWTVGGADKGNGFGSEQSVQRGSRIGSGNKLCLDHEVLTTHASRPFTDRPRTLGPQTNNSFWDVTRPAEGFASHRKK